MARITEKAIQEIVEKRARASEPDRSASWRMSSLIQTFHAPTKHRDEIIRYYPIAVVAVLDGYFRARLAELIDSGEPYLANAVGANSEIKLNLEIAEALAARKISLGELIMSSVSISNFASLVQTLSRITGRAKCLAEIARMTPRSFDTKPRKPFILEAPDTWSRLEKAFELRHILCHELAGDLAIDEAEMRLLLLAAQDFIRASGAWIERLEEPNAAKRLQDMAQSRKERGAQTKARLKELLNEIHQILDIGQLSEANDVRQSVLGAETNLGSYLLSLQILKGYAEPEFRKQRRKSIRRDTGIDSLDYAHVVEPLLERLSEMRFGLELRSRYEKREDSAEATD